MITDLTEVKIQVNSPEESEKVQKKAIKLGCNWYGRGQNINKLDAKYLFFNIDSQIGCASNYSFFIEHPFKEITIKDLFGEEQKEQDVNNFKKGDILHHSLKNGHTYLLRYSTIENCVCGDFAICDRWSYETYQNSYEDSQLRHATEEEKQWFEVCEKAGKFIKKEEALKKIKELELNIWYLDNNTLFYRTSELDTYGFNLESNDFYSTGWHLLPSSSIRKAANGEIEQAFENYIAKEYPIGAKIYLVDTFSKKPSGYEKTITKNYDKGVWFDKEKIFCKNGNMFADGVWAKKIAEPVPTIKENIKSLLEDKTTEKWSPGTYVVFLEDEIDLNGFKKYEIQKIERYKKFDNYSLITYQNKCNNIISGPYSEEDNIKWFNTENEAKMYLHEKWRKDLLKKAFSTPQPLVGYKEYNKFTTLDCSAGPITIHTPYNETIPQEYKYPEKELILINVPRI